MTQLTITKTKDYLILKIPLKAIKERKIPISAQEKKAILEGLKALGEGRVSRTFRNAKEEISFLFGVGSFASRNFNKGGSHILPALPKF